MKFFLIILLIGIVTGDDEILSPGGSENRLEETEEFVELEPEEFDELEREELEREEPDESEEEPAGGPCNGEQNVKDCVCKDEKSYNTIDELIKNCGMDNPVQYCDCSDGSKWEPSYGENGEPEDGPEEEEELREEAYEDEEAEYE